MSNLKRDVVAIENGVVLFGEGVGRPTHLVGVDVKDSITGKTYFVNLAFGKEKDITAITDELDIFLEIGQSSVKGLVKQLYKNGIKQEPNPNVFVLIDGVYDAEQNTISANWKVGFNGNDVNLDIIKAHFEFAVAADENQNEGSERNPLAGLEDFGEEVAFSGEGEGEGELSEVEFLGYRFTNGNLEVDMHPNHLEQLPQAAQKTNIQLQYGNHSDDTALKLSNTVPAPANITTLGEAAARQYDIRLRGLKIPAHPDLAFDFGATLTFNKETQKVTLEHTNKVKHGSGATLSTNSENVRFDIEFLF